MHVGNGDTASKRGYGSEIIKSTVQQMRPNVHTHTHIKSYV